MDLKVGNNGYGVDAEARQIQRATEDLIEVVWLVSSTAKVRTKGEGKGGYREEE